MRTFQGVAVSPGVAIAPVFVRPSVEGIPARRAIRVVEIDAEIERFRAGFEAARSELDGIAEGAGLSDTRRASGAECAAQLGEREDLPTPVCGPTQFRCGGSPSRSNGDTAAREQAA